VVLVCEYTDAREEGMVTGREVKEHKEAFGRVAYTKVWQTRAITSRV
jgi:hypothetical protein